MNKWQGKTAVVTGASAGIGAQIVRDLANAGVNVVALARRAEKLEALKTELKAGPGKVYALQCDVSDRNSVEGTFSKIDKEIGAIHLLINNAGILTDANILDSDSSTIDKLTQVIQTNFIGLVQCTQIAYQLIEKTNDYGMIINIGSIVGHGVPWVDFKWNVYTGTKHAVRATNEVIRQELVRKGNMKVRVSEISPGFVETEIHQAGGFIQPGEKTWLENAGLPELKDVDVSQAVLFLLQTPYTVNITEIIIKPTGENF